ncbi:MAG: dynamin family protein [Cyanobacteria bacterium J06650_10]
MDWKTASSYYEAYLSDALNVCRFAIDLANLPQAAVSSKLKTLLLEESESAKRQLDRLRKREFRIAVVGLEKAGKSTFINAWLECDLLPAKAARCTFTTTQIYSVVNDTEQRLEVQAKNESQFAGLIESLKQVNAKEDLSTIQKNETTLSEVRRHGDFSVTFTRLEDIKEPLRKYVADEQYAHAVLEARLYTNKLAQAEGVVFYDVPGLDSGLAKHVDEAKQMLSDCDAVILVQRFTSLREKELDIIKFTEHGDKNVTVADKLFVFLSRIDSQASPESFNQHIKEAAQDWANRAKLPSKRIVPGSAGAYLVLNGLAEKQTQLEIGNADSMRRQLQMLTGFEDERLEREGTGIPEIKERISQYINTERVAVLEKRCEAFVSNIIGTAEEIRDLTRKDYPDNPEEAQRFEDEKQRVLFTEWWKGKWEKIQADLQVFYQNDISKENNRESDNELASIEKFKVRYFQIVEEQMSWLREKTSSERDTIFAAISNPNFDRAKANFRWREAIYRDMGVALHEIASQLAIELKDEALMLIKYMTKLMWGSPQVKLRLIEKSETDFLEALENSLSVLFLRFARPVAEALVRGPLNSDTRSDIIEAIGVDIEIVDNYYQGDEPAFKVLKRYVKYGSDLLFNPVLRQQILGVAEVASQVAGNIAQVVDTAVENQRSPQESVIFEVENDISAFEEYLRHAIFEAAGFESYCIQELKSLLDKFREKEGTWSGIAMNEWYKGNSSLLAELPSNLQSRELNLEVSDRLRQLSVALENFKNRDSKIGE